MIQETSGEKAKMQNGVREGNSLVRSVLGPPLQLPSRVYVCGGGWGGVVVVVVVVQLKSFAETWRNDNE